MSRILVLSYCNLNRLHTGGIRRANALLEAVGSSALLCQPRPAHPKFETIAYPLNLGWKKIGINWGIFNFFWPGAQRRVARALRRHRPAAVVLTSMWDFQGVRRCAGTVPLALDAQNVNAVALAERFGARHPYTRLVAAWEGRVARAVERLCVCSTLDREQFIVRYGVDSARIAVVPNGVALAEFTEPAGPVAPEIDRQLGSAAVLFFMGKLDYQPNLEALRFINDRLIPELAQADSPPCKVLVCGGPVPAGAFRPEMIFAGRVLSVVPYLRRADVCLAPIFTGSGTRLKILEYLAAGKPVVATAKAVEGLACMPGEHLVLAEPDDVARQTAGILADPEKARSMAQRGCELVRRTYDWTAIQPAWRQALAPWIGAGGEL
jgi:glycosyltransferase involved in cell wall biosynthesis